MCGKLCIYVYLVRITASYDSLNPLSLSLSTGLAYESGECLKVLIHETHLTWDADINLSIDLHFIKQ